MTAILRQSEIIYALIVRDMMVRFGRQNLGFVWAILEPMILTTGVMLIWSLIKEPIIHGVPIIAFVMTGYLPLTLSRHLTNSMIGLLHNNISLFYHAQISQVTIIVARLILEFLSSSLALLVIYFIVVSTGMIAPVADPGLALAGWLLAAWHFAMVGVLQSVAIAYWEPLEKFVQPYQYLQLPISGVFFMVDWMPTYAQKLLLWNPTVHCYEMFRAGFFGEEVVTHYDVSYLVLVTLGLSMVAIFALLHVREHVTDH
jgi:capsular polysaccharide transport system permease protein